MTSFDGDKIIASIVQGYRTYETGHLSIVCSLIRNGEWDDSYPDNFDHFLNIFFNNAIESNNVEAMHALYKRKVYPVELRIRYMVRIGDLQGTKDYNPRHIFDLACQYNQVDIFKYYLDNHKEEISMYSGLYNSTNYGHDNLIPFFLEEEGLDFAAAIINAISGDYLSIVKSLLPKVVKDRDSFLSYALRQCLGYKSIETYKYLIQIGGKLSEMTLFEFGDEIEKWGDFQDKL